MITHKTRWLLVGLVCLALWSAHASAQGGLWEWSCVALKWRVFGGRLWIGWRGFFGWVGERKLGKLDQFCRM